MSYRTLISTVVVAVGAFLAGCTDGSNNTTSESTNIAARTSDVYYVCIGMEYSERFGSCSGCKLDSDRMDSLLKDKFGYPGVKLQSDKATRDAVTKAIADGIKITPENGLFILYYSGHGGQENLSVYGWKTSEPDGADSQDEYLCLYDSYLLDDEIWNLITQCKGRVFMCFDACHSQTMFRSVIGDIAKNANLGIPLEEELSPEVKSRGFRLKPKAIPLEGNSLRMLCWSGCLEAEYSYGGSSGGVMTNYILSNWRSGIGYTELWNKVDELVRNSGMGQHPYSTMYGTGFNEAFR